jgi:UDP-N-acetylmuramyl pentapeptide phosphotransferase/UDP-N-acetylglucosamine-1-phosphate transferase
MSSTLIGIATLACILAGYAFGAYLKWRLPENQVSGDSRDTIKQTITVIGTVTGMCLGLLVASAKDSFDQKAEGLNRIAVSIIMLDRALAHYGTEAARLRAKLRSVIESRRQSLWQEGALKTELTGTGSGAMGAIESYQDALRELRPETEAQRAIHAQATDIGNQIAATRWQVYVRSGTTIPPVFLAVLIFWQAAMFTGLGLVASRNAINGAAILVGAIAVSAAIYLILALDTPYEGLIRISDAPLRLALEQLGK